MNGFKKFLAIFAMISYATAFYLRWIHLTFFYRMMDTYWSGIVSTLLAVTVLLAIICILMTRVMKTFYATVDKIKRGESITEQERTIAFKAYSKVNFLSIITNALGFVVGQVVVSLLDVANGVVIGHPVRLAMIFSLAIVAGTINALFEIYILGSLITEERKLLRAHTFKEMSVEKRTSLKAKLMLTCVVGILITAINCYGASFQIIVQDSGAPVANQATEYFKAFFPAFIASIIPAAALMYVLASDITKRISDTSHRINSIGEQGDLSSRIHLAATDDLADLNSNLNVFISQLARIIDNFKKQTSIVADSASQLSDSNLVSITALEVMNTSVGKITDESIKQAELVTVASNDVELVTKHAHDVEDQVRSQSVAVQQSSNAVNEMAATIESVSDMASRADTLSSELRLASSNGTEAINTAIRAIVEIKEASDEVKQIIGAIQNIASQTNLLSMNAAIEAAHAGSYGQGFAVVAGEVRSLASSSSQSAKNIQDHIKGMAEKIEHGVQAIQQAGKSFTEITSGIENTSELIKTIAEAMKKQRNGANETIRSTQAVVDAIGRIQDLSVQQLSHTENVKNSILQIVNTSHDITHSLSENSEFSKGLEDAVSRVNTCVEQNTQAVQSMKKEINLFKT